MSEWAASVTRTDYPSDDSPSDVELVLSSKGHVESLVASRLGTKFVAAGRPKQSVHLHQLQHRGRLILIVLDGMAICRDLDREPTNSEAAQLALAFLNWGEDCVHHLDGQWSFLIADLEQRIFFAARDAGGTQPLFYRQHESGWLFGNRARRLASSPNLASCSIDIESIHEEIAGLAPRPWATMFHGVSRLPPGCRVSIKAGSAAVDAWWHPTPWQIGPLKSEGEQFEHFRSALAAATEDSFAGAAAPGISLSGGLDSSTLAVLAKESATRSCIVLPRAVSAFFPDFSSCDESERIRMLTRQLGMRLESMVPNPEQDVTGALAGVDRPTEAAFSPIAIGIAGTAAQAGCDVVAVGALGDFVGGVSPRWPWLTGEWEATDLRQGGRLLRSVRRARSQCSILVDELDSWMGLRGATSPTKEVGRIFGGSLASELSKRRMRSVWYFQPNPMNVRAQAAFQVAGARDVETRSVQMNFALSNVEVTFPFLDRRVMEAGLNLGPALRNVTPASKMVLRKILAKERSPREIWLNGPKTRFNEFYTAHRIHLIRDSWPKAIEGLVPYMDCGRAASLTKGLENKGFAELGAIQRLVLVGLWLRSWTET